VSSKFSSEIELPILRANAFWVEGTDSEELALEVKNCVVVVEIPAGNLPC
jgi:hypothetical protein